MFTPKDGYSVFDGEISFGKMLAKAGVPILVASLPLPLASWNQIVVWLKQIGALRQTA